MSSTSRVMSPELIAASRFYLSFFRFIVVGFSLTPSFSLLGTLRYIPPSFLPESPGLLPRFFGVSHHNPTRNARLNRHHGGLHGHQSL